MRESIDSRVDHESIRTRGAPRGGTADLAGPILLPVPWLRGALAGAVIAGLAIATPAAAATDRMGAPPPPADGGPTPSAIDSSVSAPPATLTREVDGAVRVSALQQGPGGTEVVTQRVAGRRQATAEVRRLQGEPTTAAVAVDDPVTVATDDTEYEQQWAMPRLRLPQAWPISDGSGVTIAVVDTGVDPTHPDLADNLVPGVEVVGSDTTDNVTDGHGHGTHVSGIVAAVTDNAMGVAGAAPGAHVMPVKALTDTGSGWSSDVAEGVVYAVDHGADVVNMSLSSGTDNAVLAAAVAYARSQGVVLTAAAGNARQRGNAVAYPAAFPGVIAVAATDATDADAVFSNTGTYVDVAAPGVAIRSTLLGGTYGNMSGTSMAAPHVAAVAALLLAEIDEQGPVASDDPVFDLLTRTAEDLGEPGWDAAYGYGSVDPVAALTAVTGGLPPARPGPPAIDDSDPASDPTPSPQPTRTPTPTPMPTPTLAPAPVSEPPGKPRALRVMLQRPPVAVRWSPPASGSVTRYSVRVGRVSDGHVTWRRWRSTTATKEAVQVSRGRSRVQVVAVNAAGRGPTAQRSFTVTRALLRLAR